VGERNAKGDKGDGPDDFSENVDRSGHNFRLFRVETGDDVALRIKKGSARSRSGERRRRAAHNNPFRHILLNLNVKQTQLDRLRLRTCL
jgi:hypothetical protein